MCENKLIQWHSLQYGLYNIITMKQQQEEKLQKSAKKNFKEKYLETGEILKWRSCWLIVLGTKKICVMSLVMQNAANVNNINQPVLGFIMKETFVKCINTQVYAYPSKSRWVELLRLRHASGGLQYSDVVFVSHNMFHKGFLVCGSWYSNLKGVWHIKLQLLSSCLIFWHFLQFSCQCEWVTV